MSFMNRLTGGDEIINSVDSLSTENEELKRLVVDLSSSVYHLVEVYGDIKEDVGYLREMLDESKRTNYVGKKPEILKSSLKEVEDLDEKEIRKIIYMSANNQRSGYNRLYSKLIKITGVDIYAKGKSRINKRDGLSFTNSGMSYINTLFIEGVEKEAAAIALDIIRNK